jgi:hypothetical protein
VYVSRRQTQIFERSFLAGRVSFWSIRVALPDPTDYALATIASILERSDVRGVADPAPTEKASTEQASTEKASPEKAVKPTVLTIIASAPKPFTPPPSVTKSSVENFAPPLPCEANGYSKVGPGPIAAIRLKWTVRRADSGEYFVDEIVGESFNRRPSGPMAKDAAVKLVDDREAEARRRFEQLRGEMTGRVDVNAGRGSEA